MARAPRIVVQPPSPGRRSAGVRGGAILGMVYGLAARKVRGRRVRKAILWRYYHLAGNTNANFYGPAIVFNVEIEPDIRALMAFVDEFDGAIMGEHHNA